MNENKKITTLDLVDKIVNSRNNGESILNQAARSANLGQFEQAQQHLDSFLELIGDSLKVSSEKPLNISPCLPIMSNIASAYLKQGWGEEILTFYDTLVGIWKGPFPPQLVSQKLVTECEFILEKTKQKIRKQEVVKFEDIDSKIFELQSRAFFLLGKEQNFMDPATDFILKTFIVEKRMQLCLYLSKNYFYVKHFKSFEGELEKSKNYFYLLGELSNLFPFFIYYNNEEVLLSLLRKLVKLSFTSAYSGYSSVVDLKENMGFYQLFSVLSSFTFTPEATGLPQKTLSLLGKAFFFLLNDYNSAVHCFTKAINHNTLTLLQKPDALWDKHRVYALHTLIDLTTVLCCKRSIEAEQYINILKKSNCLQEGSTNYLIAQLLVFWPYLNSSRQDLKQEDIEVLSTQLEKLDSLNNMLSYQRLELWLYRGRLFEALGLKEESIKTYHAIHIKCLNSKLDDRVGLAERDIYRLGCNPIDTRLFPWQTQTELFWVNKGLKHCNSSSFEEAEKCLFSQFQARNRLEKLRKGNIVINENEFDSRLFDSLTSKYLELNLYDELVRLCGVLAKQNRMSPFLFGRLFYDKKFTTFLNQSCHREYLCLKWISSLSFIEQYDFDTFFDDFFPLSIICLESAQYQMSFKYLLRGFDDDDKNRIGNLISTAALAAILCDKEKVVMDYFHDYLIDYYELYENDGIKEIYAILIEDNCNCPRYWYLMGVACCFLLRDNELAVECYKKALPLINKAAYLYELPRDSWRAIRYEFDCSNSITLEEAALTELVIILCCENRPDLAEEYIKMLQPKESLEQESKRNKTGGDFGYKQAKLLYEYLKSPAQDTKALLQKLSKLDMEACDSGWTNNDIHTRTMILRGMFFEGRGYINEATRIYKNIINSNDVPLVKRYLSSLREKHNYFSLFFSKDMHLVNGRPPLRGAKVSIICNDSVESTPLMKLSSTINNSAEEDLLCEKNYKLDSNFEEEHPSKKRKL